MARFFTFAEKMVVVNRLNLPFEVRAEIGQLSAIKLPISQLLSYRACLMVFMHVLNRVFD